MAYSKMIDWNGTPCVQLGANGYTAIIAYEIGSNVIRLRDDDNGIEFFKYEEQNAENVKKNPVLWGLPTLYLPNRFEDGILKTSDGEYQLPVNCPPPENTHIHGFMHLRPHKLVSHGAAEHEAFVKTQFIYNENDEFYGCFPIGFTADFLFRLGKNGFDVSVSFTNNSQKKLPVILAAHTCIAAPFVDGASSENAVVQMNLGMKCGLNERNLPNFEFYELDDYDKAYVNGTRNPALDDICNDFYYSEKNAAGEIALTVKDRESGKGIKYTVGDEFKFWCWWNNGGGKGFFCPEPMTAMINSPNIIHTDSGYFELANGENFTAKQNFKTLR